MKNDDRMQCALSYIMYVIEYVTYVIEYVKMRQKKMKMNKKTEFLDGVRLYNRMCL